MFTSICGSLLGAEKAHYAAREYRSHLSVEDLHDLDHSRQWSRVKGHRKKIHQVVMDAMEFAVESPIGLFLPTVSSQRMSLRIQKVLELDLIGDLDLRVQNSKGIAHEQPFKIWTSCNLLALAFSLWMHGSNVSRICSLGCILYFQIVLSAYVLNLWFLLDFVLEWQSLSPASIFSIYVAVVSGFYVDWEHSGFPKWISKVIKDSTHVQGDVVFHNLN